MVVGLRPLTVRQGRRGWHAKNGNPAVYTVDRRGPELVVMPVQDQFRAAAADDGSELFRIDQPFAPCQAIRTRWVMQQNHAT